MQEPWFPAQPCEIARKGVVTVHSRPAGPRAPAQRPLVQDRWGAWPQHVAILTLHVRVFSLFPYISSTNFGVGLTFLFSHFRGTKLFSVFICRI